MFSTRSNVIPARQAVTGNLARPAPSILRRVGNAILHRLEKAGHARAQQEVSLAQRQANRNLEGDALSMRNSDTVGMLQVRDQLRLLADEYAVTCPEISARLRATSRQGWAE